MFIISVSYTFYKVGFEEDIMKMLPIDEKVEQTSYILSNSRFMEKVIVMVSLEDTTNSDPNLLVQAVDALEKQFNQNPLSDYIESKIATVDPSLFTTYYQATYDHLPLYLTKEDYEKLEIEMVKGTDYLFKNLYQQLITPSGMMVKQFIPKDPYMLAPQALKKLEGFQMDNGVSIYKNHFLSEDKKTALMFLSLSHSGSNSKRNSEFLALFHQASAKIKAENKALKFELFGNPIVALSNAEIIKSDVHLTVSIALIFIILLISYYFRDKFIFLLLLIPILFGFGSAVIFMHLFKDSISLIAMGMGAILIGISIDFSLHVLTHYRESGSSEKVIKELSIPILLSAVTTSISFLCLYFLKAEAMNDLGLFVAISIVFSACTALVVLPILLDKIGYKGKKNRKTPIIDLIAGARLEKQTWLVIVVLLFVTVCFFFTGRVSFDPHLDKFNYNAEEVEKARHHIESINASIVENILLASQSDNLDDAVYENYLLQSELKNIKTEGFQFEEMMVSELIIPSKIQEERIQLWKSFWTKERIEQLKKDFSISSQKVGFKQGVFKAFWHLIESEVQQYPVEEQIKKYETLVGDFIIYHDNKYAVTSLLKVDDLRQKKDIIKVLKEETSATVIEKQNFLNDIINLLHLEFDTLVMMSSFVVFALLLLTFGRIELTIISYAPIILSWVMTLGVMGMLNIQFNIFNVIISAFIFGIGVDYSIFITKGLEQNVLNRNTNTLKTYKSSILLSSITTLLGIGAMFFAEHPSLRSMGTLTIIGVVSVIVMTFIVQPVLYNIFITDRVNKGRLPIRFFQLLRTIVGYLIFIVTALILSFISLLLFIPGWKWKLKSRKLLLHYLLYYFCKVFLSSPLFKRNIFLNREEVDLKEPSIIIANHQSFLDIFLVIATTPKTILFTNHWVYNSPLFGKIVQNADYFLASNDMDDQQLEKFKTLVADGYSIIIFPEGTRSETGVIKRFHKGAFFLSEKLKLDIQPMFIQGTHRAISKGDFYFETGDIKASFLPRIKVDDSSWGNTYQERTKSISKYFKEEYKKFIVEVENVDYFKNKVLHNYLYKGPVTEWYVRIKLMLENNFRLLDALIPREAVITDLGCGLGYATQMLGYISPKRNIIGVDYDEDKIRIAQSGVFQQKNIQFETGNITNYRLKKSDVFIISDVLHYVPKKLQIDVLDRCLAHLNPNGFLLIRDGNKDDEEKQKKTKLAETWSTKIIQFNKTEYNLEFISKNEFTQIIEERGCTIETIPMSKVTSNCLYVIRKIEN